MKIIKKLMSRLDHYSVCERCGLSWNYVETGPAVPYQKHNDDTKAFCICQECWEKCSVDQIVMYFRKSWNKYNKTPSFPTVKDKIREEVEQRKSNE